LAALVVLALAGCAAPVAKLDSGEQSAGERLFVTLKGPWNRVDTPGVPPTRVWFGPPAQVWTMEGLTIDQLLIYSGIKDQELIHPANPASSGRKNFAFRSTMQPDEIVGLYEGMFTRDGS